ncbi:SCO3242 family prenyltransferase [Streptomyces sp. NPDC006879]|uniref:SCO3242 family prenyltransferase n=1 Tax=Streptomyces sp. NPDC006879 TaxID=3364767 RepID=UPI0036C70C9B
MVSGHNGGVAIRAWAELLRVSALFSVPGDAFAGAAATGARPNRRTTLAALSSLCLYEAGMALNDWADREQDALERPHRPLPSGRITPRAALTGAGALTLAGLALGWSAGRRAGTVATALSATVWAYDLGLKHTPAAPAAMAAARGLDLLLGATATSPHALRRALAPAATLGAHTYAVTAVSRHEVQGGSARAPLAALAATTALAALTVRRPAGAGASAAPAPRVAGAHRLPGGAGGPAGDAARAEGPARHPLPAGDPTGDPPSPLRPERRSLTGTGASVAVYALTAARPYWHAALNPSPALTQRAVGGGIRALIPLQAALSARAGARPTAAALLGLVPLARTLSRKVSPT